MGGPADLTGSPSAVWLLHVVQYCKMKGNYWRFVRGGHRFTKIVISNENISDVIWMACFCFFCQKKKKNEWAANVHWVEETKGPWGSREFQGHLRGGLIETGGLSKLENMMVSVLRKELEYKVEKIKYKKVGGHAPLSKRKPNYQSW